MGPLQGLKVIEIEGLGPAPFCGMMLADMGAEVITVGRAFSAASRADRISERGKRTIALNLKRPEAIGALLDLVAGADVLIEGFRPGVAERLGFGPDVCQARNPRLVYGRMTGWGQTGPLAQAAGHDINYIALSGALHAIGRAGEKPVPPLNLVGDFGGGGMFLAFGVMCAVFEAQRSGKGQVVDASMVEGAATLMHMMYAMKASGAWRDERGVNILDTGAHFYDTYETADGKYIALGSIEPQFYALLMERAGLDPAQFSPQNDASQWSAMRDRLAAVIRGKTREEWCALMEGSDVCFAPVLSMSEAPQHPHNLARGSFLELAGVTQAAPAPRFSRTAPAVPEVPHPAGSDTLAVLREAGYTDERLEQLRAVGALA